MTPTPRIGLFGGSFNPPHLAHLALAALARDALGLDEVRWLVAGAPWQKAGSTLVAAADRVAMVRLLIQGQARMLVDEREIHRAGPSYTMDSVLELRREFPGHELVLVLGQDQYANFHTWSRFAELLSQVSLAVAARAGAEVVAPTALASLPHHVIGLHLPPLHVSATEVRERVAAGQDVRALVGSAVAGYISQHRLYLAATRS